MTVPRRDPSTGRRGRPPLLTGETIGRAVLDVGFTKLTFAAVRERLGVGETTLFRYAHDRDELVRYGLDYAVAHTTWPPLTGHWRDILGSYALTAWHTWEAHPGSATETARGIVPRGAMRLVEDLCSMLVGHGFTAESAVLACDLVFDLAADSRRGVEHLDTLVPGAGPSREHLHRSWTGTASSEAGDAGATGPVPGQIHDAIGSALTADPLDWFTHKLTVVLNGIEHTLAPGTAPVIAER